MRLLRWIVRLSLGVALLCLVAAVGGFHWLGSDHARAWLLDRLPALAGAQGIEVTIGSSDGSLLGRLRLQDVRVAVDGHHFAADEVLLHWRPRALLARRLHVVDLGADGLRITLATPVDDQPAAAPALPDIRLPLAVHVDRFAVAGLSFAQGETHVALARVAGAIAADARYLSLRDLRVIAPDLAIAGEAEMQAVAPHGVDARLQIDADASLTGPEVGDARLAVVLSGPALQPTLALALQEPAIVRVAGDLDLRDVTPRFDLAANWQALAWPLRGERLLDTADAALTLRGTPDAYRLDGAVQLLPVDGPPARVELRLDGDLEGIVLEAVQIDTLDGQLAWQGQVNWADGVDWQLAGIATGIDPAGLDPAWPGRIDARLRIDGSLLAGTEGALSWRAVVDEVSGTLRDYPVALSGQVGQHGDELTLTDIVARSGPNQLDIDGSLGQRLDLVARLSAPRLDAVYPSLAGSLTGDARIGGSLEKPRVDLRLAGDGIAFDDLRVDALTLVGDWRDARIEATAALTGVDLQGRQLERVDLRVNGSEAAHRIALDADAEAWQLALAARGGLQGQAWSGTLQDLTLVSDEFDDWRLAQPVALSLAGDAVGIGDACLAHIEERVCFTGRWRSVGGVRAGARITALDLARLAPFLPGDAVVQGLLDGRADVAGDPASPSVDVALVPRDGMLRFEADEALIELPYRDARIKLAFANDRGELAFNLLLGGDGIGRGRASLGPQGPAGRKLSGKLAADFPDLGLLAGFVPVLAEVKGGFRLAADLAGTTASPRVLGRMSIDNATALVPAAGIRLEEIDLVVSGDGTGPLQVDGLLRSGEGTLRLNGGVELAQGQQAGVDLRIAGEDFQVVRLPEATVAISPDLYLQGRQAYRLTGNLDVPTARIEVTELPSGSVKVSADEVIVSNQGDVAAVEQASNPPVSGEVRVTLGDDVEFEGFGLRTGLSGVLLARFDPQGQSVEGNIAMRDGRFERFGQSLTIEQGRLIFGGPPDDPDVDLRASRLSRDGNVTAYLAMSGPLRQPLTRIYSEPALPQSQALSYLITGRGLDQAGGGQLDIASAAFALGIGQGESWLQDISSRFGIDEFSIETGEDGIEDSSLLIGTYLSPDLYVGYVQELFNPEGAVLVRMRLNEMFEVETRSGRSQSVDLIFRREHD